MKKDRHHLIPASLDGADVQENVVVIERSVHDLIHNTLCIPYFYIRAFRFKNAWKRKKDKEYVSDLRKLHLMYFSNLKHLPEEIQEMHRNGIEKQVYLLAKMKKRNVILVDFSFHSLLLAYHELLL
jgi:hypothetical protein